MVTGTKPIPLGFRLQPRQRWCRLSTGIPGHAKRVFKWQFPICCHVVSKMIGNVCAGGGEPQDVMETPVVRDLFAFMQWYSVGAIPKAQSVSSIESLVSDILFSDQYRKSSRKRRGHSHVVLQE